MKLTFDNVVCMLFGYVPLLGELMKKTYLKYDTLRKFMKYYTSIFIVYWVVRAPIQWYLIDNLGLWHQTGTFIAGIIVSTFGFMYSHFWVWRKGD